MDLLEFFINNLPLSVNNALEILYIAYPDFGIFFLRLELKFDLQNDDLRVGKLFGLLLKTCIGEGLFEGDPAHQKRVINRSTCDFFDTDQVLIKQVSVQLLNSGYHDLSEKLLVAREKFRVQSSLCTTNEHFSSSLRGVVDCDYQTIQVAQAKLESLFIASDNDLRVHTIFDKAFGIF